jgi:hypothetical protein
MIINPFLHGIPLFDLLSTTVLLQLLARFCPLHLTVGQSDSDCNHVINLANELVRRVPFTQGKGSVRDGWWGREISQVSGDIDL